MSTRSKKKAEAPVPITTSKTRVENSWTLLAKESLLDNKQFTIITLPHPGNKKPAKYCLDEANNRIYEIVTFDESNRSWFISNTVKSDGSIQMVTPVNPLFLVLPKLKELCSDRAIPLEDLLSEKGYDKIITFVPDLDCIGDIKGSPDMKAYKFNEKKALSWLQGRVRKLATVLREKNIHVTSGATSATFVTSTLSNDNVDEEFYLKYASGLVSEYLTQEMAAVLEKQFNFKPDLIENIGKKRKSENEANDTSKRIKSDDNKGIQEENGFVISNKNNEVKKEKQLTTKEKARQKAASGTKTISSFFKKKCD